MCGPGRRLLAHARSACTAPTAHSSHFYCIHLHRHPSIRPPRKRTRPSFSNYVSSPIYLITFIHKHKNGCQLITNVSKLLNTSTISVKLASWLLNCRYTGSRRVKDEFTNAKYVRIKQINGCIIERAKCESCFKLNCPKFDLSRRILMKLSQPHFSIGIKESQAVRITDP